MILTMQLSTADWMLMEGTRKDLRTEIAHLDLTQLSIVLC